MQSPKYYTLHLALYSCFVIRLGLERILCFAYVCSVSNASFIAGIRFVFFEGLYSNVYQQKEDAGSEDNDWASLIISLADGKTDDKSLETVMNSNLYNVLIGIIS